MFGFDGLFALIFGLIFACVPFFVAAMFVAVPSLIIWNIWYHKNQKNINPATLRVKLLKATDEVISTRNGPVDSYRRWHVLIQGDPTQKASFDNIANLLAGKDQHDTDEIDSIEKEDAWYMITVGGYSRRGWITFRQNIFSAKKI